MTNLVNGKSEPETTILSVTEETLEEAVAIETHLHSRETWFGAAAVPSGETHVADIDSMTPFVPDAGNDTWGAWVQVLGSDDTPVDTGKTKFDLHRMFISTVERANAVTRVQVSFGETAAAGLAANDFTSIMFSVPATGRQTPVTMQQCGRADAGTKVWVRVWVDSQNTGTVSLFFGAHEYDV